MFPTFTPHYVRLSPILKRTVSNSGLIIMLMTPLRNYSWWCRSICRSSAQRQFAISLFNSVCWCA